MSLSQAGAASNVVAPSNSGWRGLGGYDRYGSPGQRTSPAVAAGGAAGDQVSLSDASRMLAALGGGADASGNTASSSDNSAGSSDFAQEASYLGGIADASLVALGIITPDQQSSTQVSFDSLSYQVSSSVAAGYSQQNGQTVAEYGSEQQAQFVGQGHITTADGRTFDFQIEVDLDQSQRVEAASGGNSSGNAPANVQSGADPAAAASRAATGAASSQSPLDPINWDAILKQSKSLIDLLESIHQELPTADLANSAAGLTAGSTAAAGTGAATQGGNASSGDAQAKQTSQSGAALAA